MGVSDLFYCKHRYEIHFIVSTYSGDIPNLYYEDDELIDYLEEDNLSMFLNQASAEEYAMRLITDFGYNVVDILCCFINTDETLPLDSRCSSIMILSRFSDDDSHFSSEKLLN